jgi:hypothetical protein
MKKLLACAMLSVAAFSLIAQCCIQYDCNCRGQIYTSHGPCHNVTNHIPCAREACVGEEGRTPVTEANTECRYICEDGEKPLYYGGLYVGTDNCHGDRNCNDGGGRGG